MKIEVKNIGVVEGLLTLDNAKVKLAVASAIKQSGHFIQGEVVQSVSGHRAEPKSVDTGRFMNSIKVNFPKKTEAIIDTNVGYAKYLEYGTSKIEPRHHFRNTEKRNIGKVKDFIKAKVNAVI